MQKEKEVRKIIKASGKKVVFLEEKLKSSLQRTGASEERINAIVKKITDNLKENTHTKAIYKKAFELLKKENSYHAAKYKLKKAIYELGPTGFPFEHFISALLSQSGYKTKVGEVVKGKCVTHEIDILVFNEREVYLMECKFHAEQGKACNVKVPMYINSRYNDVKQAWELTTYKIPLTQGWVVTNTRFTTDAIQYGVCVGLNLLSWDYPSGKSLRERVDKLGLYPITCLTLLTKAEKQQLLSKNIVLCKELREAHFLLDHIGVSAVRKQKILSELHQLCSI
jgi:hypothetical protein